MSTSLYIDTSRKTEISIAVIVGGREYRRDYPSRIYKAQTVLPLLETLLKEAKISIHDIDEITVQKGEESLTGLRVGFAIAQMLSVLLDIPVNGNKDLKVPYMPPVSYKTVDTK